MFYWFLAVAQWSCFVVLYMYMLAIPFDAMICSCSIYFLEKSLKVCIVNLFSALLCFSLSLRICYDLQSCLDECHWSRGYMEMLSNHVFPCLTCSLVPCFLLLCSCNVASLFHASNMSTCYSCSHVCHVFHQVIICVIMLPFALIMLD